MKKNKYMVSKLDKPKEIMIEVESKCNFNCTFCFNNEKLKKNNKFKNLSSGKIKKILNHIDSLGIKIVRFTGGEPFLRKDLIELISHANNLGLSVRLNTNGSLITKEVAKQLKGKVDGVLISVQSSNPDKEDKITGHKKSLLKKMQAINYLKKSAIPVVRIGTVISRESVEDFDNLFKIFKNSKIYSWEWYREIKPDKKETILKKDITSLVEKILKTKSGFHIKIANPIPFCVAGDMQKVAQASNGAMADNGNTRLVVDSRGFMKPDYYDDTNLGDPLDIMSSWNNPVIVKNRKLKNLPTKCIKCEHRDICRGGNIFMYNHKDIYNLEHLIRKV